jgi:hypothetical protein
MLSFQLTNENRTIQVLCDDAGISTLIEVLEKLRGSSNHIHLRSPRSGGKLLSDTTPFGEEAIGEVIITHGGD